MSLASITLLFQGEIILPALPSLSYSLPLAAATASGKEGKKVVALKDFPFTPLLPTEQPRNACDIFVDRARSPYRGNSYSSTYSAVSVDIDDDMTTFHKIKWEAQIFLAPMWKSQRALTKQITLNMLFHFQFAVTNDSPRRIHFLTPWPRRH